MVLAGRPGCLGAAQRGVRGAVSMAWQQRAVRTGVALMRYHAG